MVSDLIHRPIQILCYFRKFFLCFILKVKLFFLSRRLHNRFSWPRTRLRVIVARPGRPLMLDPMLR